MKTDATLHSLIMVGTDVYGRQRCRVAKAWALAGSLSQTATKSDSGKALSAAAWIWPTSDGDTGVRLQPTNGCCCIRRAGTASIEPGSRVPESRRRRASGFRFRAVREKSTASMHLVVGK